MSNRTPSKLIIVVVALATCAAALAACGSSGSSGTSDAGGGESGVKIGLGITGPRNDKGFYQAAYEGATAAAEKSGAALSVIDNLAQPQERFDALKNLSIENQLVIGGGAEFADAVQALAAQFPDVDYVVLTGAVSEEFPNVSAFVPRQGVPAYIAGAVAAELSKTDKIGFVGGEEIPPTDSSNAAFEAGAEAQKSGIGYATTNVGSFGDPAGAKNAASAQLASGADVIFAFLDAGTPGVEQAIESAGGKALAIAAISPRCEESKTMLGTAVLDVADLTEKVIDEFEEEKLPEGKTKYFGIEDPKLQRFELCPAYKTPKLEGLVEELSEQINAGEISLPKGV